jgi:hypothetical protein
MVARLSDVIVEIGTELVGDLSEESPLYRSICDGTVDREAYGLWLTQQHKYMRWTHDLLKDYARGLAASGQKAARSITTGASRHAEEERGHDDHVLADLAAVWNVTPEQAFERVERTPTSPGVHFYEAIARRTIADCPAGFAGFAMAIEILAGSMSSTARAAFLEKPPFDGAENTIRIFADHEDDGIHVEGGRYRVDALEDPTSRVAAVAAAHLLKEAYRALFADLDVQLGNESGFMTCRAAVVTP